MSIFIALSLLAAGPVEARPAPSAPTAARPADPDLAEVERAGTLNADGKRDEALAALDRFNAAQAKKYAGETREVYCARSAPESLLYLGMAAKGKKGAVVTPRSYCYGIFLRGFVLIDLNRSEEAKADLERAVALAPQNAQFLGELAEWYKNRRDWPKARALFEQAIAASDFSPEDRKSPDKRRGMRGVGFVLIELGKLDEAEALFKRVLEIDPGDAGAKQELQYIKEQRAKRT